MTTLNGSKEFNFFEIANKPFIELINKGLIEDKDRKLTRQCSAQVFSQALLLKSEFIKLKSRRIIEEQQAYEACAILHQKEYSQVRRIILCILNLRRIPVFIKPSSFVQDQAFQPLKWKDQRGLN